jgi:hypothetical protein
VANQGVWLFRGGKLVVVGRRNLPTRASQLAGEGAPPHSPRTNRVSPDYPGYLRSIVSSSG